MKKKSVLSLLLAAALALSLAGCAGRGSRAERSLSSTATGPSRKKKTT